MGGDNAAAPAKTSIHGEVLERLNWTLLAQTYEGGLGGEPGSEAHGGYTFCGLAALHLAGYTDVLCLPRLLHWAVHRQVRVRLPCSRPSPRVN